MFRSSRTIGCCRACFFFCSAMTTDDDDERIVRKMERAFAVVGTV